MTAVNVILIALNQSTQALVTGGIALFLPLIRQDVPMTFAQSGMLAAATIISYAAMQIPAGALADRVRPKTQFLVGLLGVTFFTFSFSLLSDFGLMLVNLAILGFFRSLVFAPGMMLMTNQFADNRRATAMGIYVAGGFSSNIVLSLIGPLFIAPLGWRGMFMVFALYGLALITIQFFIGDPGPAKRERKHGRTTDMRRILTSRVLWICCGIQFVRFAVASGLNFWLPSFLIEDRDFSLAAAGLVVGIGALVTALSNAFGGLVSDVLRKPAHVVMISVLVLAATLWLLPEVGPLPLIIGLVAIQSIFVQVYFGPLFEIPTLFLGREVTGLTTGIANMFANVGALVSGIALGAIKDSTDSFAPGFHGLAILCVLAAVGAFVLVRMDRKRVATLTAVPVI